MLSFGLKIHLLRQGAALFRCRSGGDQSSRAQSIKTTAMAVTRITPQGVLSFGWMMGSVSSKLSPARRQHRRPWCLLQRWLSALTSIVLHNKTIDQSTACCRQVPQLGKLAAQARCLPSSVDSCFLYLRKSSTPYSATISESLIFNSRTCAQYQDLITSTELKQIKR